MVRMTLWLAAGAFMVASAGCAPGTERIVVRGSPSLDALFVDLAEAYRRHEPRVQVALDFSCPPCVLYRRPQERPETDLFASLGEFELERVAEAAGVSFPHRVTLGHTALSLVTSDRVAAQVKSLADLHTASVRRIGVGDPDTVGVGHYTREALTRAGLWAELEDRLVYSQSGCELLKWLGLGREVDAAIVFTLCHNEGMGAIRTVLEFPEDLIPPVPLILALTQDAPAPAAAQRFAQFAAGPHAHSILAAHGLTPVNAHD